MNKKVFIVAEAGVNHNGSLENAKKMVDVAVECASFTSVAIKIDSIVLCL